MSCAGYRCCKLLGPLVQVTGKRRLAIVQQRIPHTRRQHFTSQQAQAGPSSSPYQSYPLPASQQASPYEVFHLSNNSTSSEIKARYYDLVKIYHPDRVLAAASSSHAAAASSVTSEKANEDFKRIREAYNLLGDERRRRLYDRSGIGWGREDNLEDSFGGHVWKGGFPRTPEEMAAYERWSNSFRRGSPGSMNRQGWQFRGQSRGHDKFGWQNYAGTSSNLGSEWFYGYGHSRSHFNGNGETAYTTNERFFIVLSFLTLILGVGQFFRLREESRIVVGNADRRHQDAARSLVDARKFARSEAGRARLDEMKKRARERLSLEGRDLDNVGEPGVGHGGSSGREAYEERMRRIGWSTDDE